MRQLTTWPSRLLTILVTTIITTTAVVAPAVAKPRNRADVTVTINAPRNILPVDGGSTVTAVVRNDGKAPAAGVRVTMTLPDQMPNFGLSTSSEWDCDLLTHTEVGCNHVGPLAAGAEAYGVSLSASVTGATIGVPLTARAAVTTTSRESDTTNNRDTQVFQIVDKGLIQGVYWNDLDADGVREPGEPLVDPMFLGVWSVDDDDLYGFSNGFGPYQLEVPAKRYYVEVTLFTSSWRFTTPNVGDDATDSDPVLYSETSFEQRARVETFTVDPAQPTVIDVGVIATS
jgi:hypothetical protein